MNFLKSASTGAELNYSPCETNLIFLSWALLIFTMRTFTSFSDFQICFFDRRVWCWRRIAWWWGDRAKIFHSIGKLNSTNGQNCSRVLMVIFMRRAIGKQVVITMSTFVKFYLFATQEKMTLPPERAAELAKSPRAHKWKMIKAKVWNCFHYFYQFLNIILISLERVDGNAKSWIK